MEWNQQTLEFFTQCYIDDRSNEPEIRQHGRKNLSDASDKPNYTLAFLRFVTEPSIDEKIRYWAALDSNSHIFLRWKASLKKYTPIPESEKEEIKKLIIPLALSATPPMVQWTVSETIAVGIGYDILPELKYSLENAINVNDIASVNVILSIFNDMFKIFRYRFGLDPNMSNEYKYCLDNFFEPLLTTVESLSVKTNTAAATGCPEALCELIQAQRYCCRIFFSLNYFGMPEFIKDNADKWMNEFKNYLTFRYPSVETNHAGRVTVDNLRLAVFHNIIYHLDHDMFQKYLREFVEAVWSLPIDIISNSLIGEELIVNAIRFLMNVNTKFPHVLFSGDLKNYMQILDILLTPNLRKKWEQYSAVLRDLPHLLESFIKHAPNELNTKERLEHVVGSVITLVSSPENEEEKITILNQLIENLGYDAMEEHMINIWDSLFTRLQNSKTSNFVSYLIVFMSRFLVKHGTQTLVDSINSVRENLFIEILGEYWIPNLKTVVWYKNVKLCAIASTKLLCKSPLLLDSASEELWGKLLDGIVSLLLELEYGNKFDYRKEDPLKEITNPVRYSVDLFANLCRQFRGRFWPIIDIYLSQANQDALIWLCYSYNRTAIE